MEVHREFRSMRGMNGSDPLTMSLNDGVVRPDAGLVGASSMMIAN